MTLSPHIKDPPRSSWADLRGALWCALALVVAVALTWPVAEIAYNDDWSYAFTVQQLLVTGKLAYNGWASASLIEHAYWGALWVKCFGFSFTVLRLSTVPPAAGAVGICYLLGRRAGLLPSNAALSAMLLGLSPLYLPVAATFMTDAPGLFFILLSIYAIVRSIESPAFNSAVGWLVLGVAVGLIGGTGRQIVWVVPLVLVPYAAFLRRRQTAFVFPAALGWLTVLIGAFLTLRWFGRQPYSIPEASLRTDLRLALNSPVHFALEVLAIALTTIWATIPVTIFLLRGWTWQRGLITAGLLAGFALVLVARPRYSAPPWLDNTMTPHGVMGGNEITGPRPVTMSVPVRFAFSAVVFLITGAVVADAIAKLFRPQAFARRIAAFFVAPPPNRIVLPALTLFATAYCVLLLPRSAQNMVYDRYVLPLIPCIVIPLLLRFQNYAHRGDADTPRGQKDHAEYLRDTRGSFRRFFPVFSASPRFRGETIARVQSGVNSDGRIFKTIAWALVGIYAVFAVATTQEVTALARARVTAADRLIAAGVARASIDGGFEFDYYTELLTSGHINDKRIKVPKGAVRTGVSRTPSIAPVYRLEFAPASDTEKTPFGTVTYFSLYPPFHRMIYIDRFMDPWWLDAKRAATRPMSSHSLIPDSAADDH